MALLDSFYGDTPQYLSGLLGADELSRLQEQARGQSNLGMATALLRAGAPSRTPTNAGLAIAEGLQAGQDMYRKVLGQGLQDKVTALQTADLIRKSNEAANMRQMFPQIFKMEGDNMVVDRNKLQALAANSSNPLETYSALAKLVPDLRKAGFVGGTQQENPFDIFVNDPTVPATFRAAAAQYQKSYASGMLDPEKVDERVRQLASSIQSAQQFAQAQAGLEQNRALLGSIAREKQDAATEKRDAAVREKEKAKSDLTDVVSSLKKNYETLKESGGIVSSADTGLSNLGAKFSSSSVGQALESATGAKTQVEREKIEQTRPLLLNLIKNATGMSAQQMNSNAEMQMYLNAATNPKLSYEANMEALKNLDSLYGLGLVSKEIEKELKNPKKPSGPSRGAW